MRVVKFILRSLTALGYVISYLVQGVGLVQLLRVSCVCRVGTSKELGSCSGSGLVREGFEGYESLCVFFEDENDENDENDERGREGFEGYGSLRVFVGCCGKVRRVRRVR